MSQTNQNNQNLNFDLPISSNRPNPQREKPFQNSEKNSPPQRPVLTEEEKQKREANRTQLIDECRVFIRDFIVQRKPRPFRYSPPAPQGAQTQYFSQICIDTSAETTNRFRLTNLRPMNHPPNLWYFPIYYMMNGFTKNPTRTFQALGLVPVEVELKQQLAEDTTLEVRFYYHRQYGNTVKFLPVQTPAETPSEAPAEAASAEAASAEA